MVYKAKVREALIRALVAGDIALFDSVKGQIPPSSKERLMLPQINEFFWRKMNGLHVEGAGERKTCTTVTRFAFWRFVCGFVQEEEVQYYQLLKAIFEHFDQEVSFSDDMGACLIGVCQFGKAFYFSGMPLHSEMFQNSETVNHARFLMVLKMMPPEIPKSCLWSDTDGFWDQMAMYEMNSKMTAVFKWILQNRIPAKEQNLLILRKMLDLIHSTNSEERAVAVSEWFMALGRMCADPEQHVPTVTGRDAFQALIHHLADRFYWKKGSSVFLLNLLRIGADPSAVNAHGKSALEMVNEMVCERVMHDFL